MDASSDLSRHFVRLSPGDPAPWFRQRSTSHPRHQFDTSAGRYVVMCFYGTASDEDGSNAVAAALAHQRLFDDEKTCFFGISLDPGDETHGRVRQVLPGIRHIWDFDAAVSRLYGAAPAAANGAALTLRRFWMVLDPTLTVLKTFDLKDQAALFAYLAALPPVSQVAGFEVGAPILVLPNVFEPELCRQLIDLYERHGGTESGFMRQIGGRTVGVQDRSYKSRKDHVIEDLEVIRAIQARFQRRVASIIQRVHHFNATRMERYIVSCYAAEDGGHFHAHRDNTTSGTAHRQFAASINLNADFEGGELNFPEYGPRSFKPLPGTAVVFSCALLHAVSRVTAGRRFAFLPFLYDEEAAKVREANLATLDGVPPGTGPVPAMSGETQIGEAAPA